MHINLIRYYRDNSVTLGVLDIEDVKHDPIYTLENPWKDNKRNISCIPLGDYECSHFNGTKYHNVYEVKDVPDRTAILIHVGNYERNTRGCILPGLGVIKNNGEMMVTNSTLAMNKLRTLIGKQDFTLTIKDL